MVLVLSYSINYTKLSHWLALPALIVNLLFSESLSHGAVGWSVVYGVILTYFSVTLFLQGGVGGKSDMWKV